MTPPKILCVSLGSIGKRHLRNARALVPSARIAVWRQHTRAAGGVPEGADAILATADEALAFGPDAVIISSPASEHLKNAAPFVDRQLPIFLEKPLAATAAGVDEFARQCKASRGFIMVGYVLRFLPALHTIKRLMREGALGDVLTAHIQVGQYLPDWRPDSDYRSGVSAQAKLGGGALLELSHEIDYATWLLGWPRSLQCSSARLSSLEIDVEDSAHLLLEYADKRVLVQLDFLQRVANMAVQMVGTKATLNADLVKEELHLVTPADPKGTRVDSEKLPNGNDLYLRQFDYFFHRALPGRYTARYPGTAAFAEWAGVDHAAGVMRLVDLAKKASDSGQRQGVPS
jgi:predicted dehydrogenase